MGEETDTRDRVIALERDVIHLGGTFEKFQDSQIELQKINSKEHNAITKSLERIDDAVNGGFDERINKAISKHMPKQLNRGLTISDKVQQAIVSGFFVALAAWAGAGFPPLW